MSESSKSCVNKGILTSAVNPNWFLTNGEYAPSICSFEALINGEAAFGRLFDEIESATKSIEIAIWGFQPSMFFKRDGVSPCIGELLVKKAMAGVKVKVLVWSMFSKVQTFVEANLGNAKTLKAKNQWQSPLQAEYDAIWYRIMESKRQNSINFSPINQGIFAGHALEKFNTSSYRDNLNFETRSVEFRMEYHLDKISWAQSIVLALAASHHQKTVLIDYENPAIARGFVLEHNMLDNYWDSSAHLSSSDLVTQPNQGRNGGPLQDVSSFVRGPVLHDINANFCQSWDKVAKQSLLSQRKSFAKEAYALPAAPNLMMLQALRTYSKPEVEQIKELYLQNIKQTTSYIYTENQYFRWPPLIESFKAQWQKMKEYRCDPIYWFIVTNSTDAGIGKGTINTDRMYKLLGRQDVMPGVAIKNSKELQREQEEFKKKKLLEQQARGEAGGGSTPALDANGQPLSYDPDFANTLKKDVSDEIGIKAHICVLSAKDSWEEVYVHSKVTIINDSFVTMGSANINTRSMQTDTEFNIALEHGATAQKLRKDLWNIHINDAAANPDLIASPVQAKDVFIAWQRLLKSNNDLKESKSNPQQSLTEFLRTDSTLSNQD